MEGFVKVDGEKLSVAAQKLKDEAETEYEKRYAEWEEKMKHLSEVRKYLHSDEAAEFFKTTAKSFTKEKQVKTRGLFGTSFYEVQKSVDSVDYIAMYDYLYEVDERWMYTNPDFWDLPEPSYNVNALDYHLPANSAKYFTKYIGLKGDVFLPISEYNMFKEYL